MKTTKSLPSIATAFALLAAAVTPSCQNSAQSGALIGAGAGALAGRAIDDDNRGRGAVLGGVIGSIVGGLGGAAVDAERAERYNEQRYYQQQQQQRQQQPVYSGGTRRQQTTYNQGYQQPTPPRQDNYPYGTFVSPNRIRSPYPPNTLLDTGGYPRGGTVVDPTTGKPFRIP